MVKYLFILCLSLYSTQAFSCDICGCGLSARSFGILPQFRSNFVGLKAQYRTYHSVHPPLFDSQDAEESDERFVNTEIWGRFTPWKKFQFFYFVPVQWAEKKEEDNTNYYSGLGDISLMANYLVLSTDENDVNEWRHALQIGSGIKLPTGIYNNKEPDGTVIMNLQPGTGSIAVPVNLIYTQRYKGFGINGEFNYTVNFTNKNGFEFGDRSGLGVSLFYWQEWEKLSLLPGLGLNYQYAFKDFENNIMIDESGGNNLNLNLGADLYFNSFSFGLHAQLPVYQHVNEGNVQIKQNLSTSLIYNF